MAYKLVKTELGYLPLNITGDGIIIASVKYSLNYLEWFSKLSDEFKRFGKIKESQLFARLCESMVQTKIIDLSKIYLIELGFSVEFANAWESAEMTGLQYLSLVGVEKVAGSLEYISEEDFERNLAVIFGNNW